MYLLPYFARGGFPNVEEDFHYFQSSCRLQKVKLTPGGAAGYDFSKMNLIIDIAIFFLT